MDKNGRPWREALTVFFLCFSAYWFWRPPVYSFDGYTYQIQGFQVLENLNPHHLFWIPAQALLNRIALMSGISPLLFCQGTGIMISALTVMLLYVLCFQLSRDRGLSALFALFLALSPQFWFLAMQNEPYPPLFLFLLLAFWGCAHFEKTHRLGAIAGAGCALAMAVHFQQAALLLFIPFTLFVIYGERSEGRSRWGALSITLAAVAGLVILPYVVLARLSGIDSIAEFRGWLTDYLDSQHGLQYHWIGLVKTVIGIVRSLIQSAPFEWMVARRLSTSGIMVIYIAAGVLGFSALWASRKQWHPEPKHRRLAWLCLGMIGVWSFFVFSWEPLTGYYWCLSLIFGILVAAIAAPRWTAAMRRRVMGCLMVMTAWNGYANIRQDRLERTRNPDPWLAEIHSMVGPHDLMLFLDRSRIDYLDYDLLFFCMDMSQPGVAKALLTDYAANQNQPAWEKNLLSDLENVMRLGGRIWISQHVLDSKNYRDVTGENDLFSPYPLDNLRGIDGPEVFRKVSRLLASYALQSSPLVIGNDRFFEIAHR